MNSYDIDRAFAEAIDHSGGREAYTHDALYKAEAERVREVIRVAGELVDERRAMNWWDRGRFLADLAERLLPDPREAAQRRIELAARLAEEMNRPIRIPVELTDLAATDSLGWPVGALRAQEDDAEPWPYVCFSSTAAMKRFENKSTTFTEFRQKVSEHGKWTADEVAALDVPGGLTAEYHPPGELLIKLDERWTLVGETGGE
ncbi:hypothetical protein [Microbispora sp. NPDC049633]|uniref:hypothetical protein n=1 Tax=Microbispora sp. NPDC049633 TaxID=3154355 RepID=UPI003436D1D4